jgi:hypothetical protein
VALEGAGSGRSIWAVDCSFPFLLLHSRRDSTGLTASLTGIKIKTHSLAGVLSLLRTTILQRPLILHSIVRSATSHGSNYGATSIGGPWAGVRGVGRRLVLFVATLIGITCVILGWIMNSLRIHIVRPWRRFRSDGSRSLCRAFQRILLQRHRRSLGRPEKRLCSG